MTRISWPKTTAEDPVRADSDSLSDSEGLNAPAPRRSGPSDDAEQFFDIGKIVEKIEQEQTARMKALLEVSRRMNATLDEEQLLPFMMAKVLDLMQADHGHLVLITQPQEGTDGATGVCPWEIKVSMARINQKTAAPSPPSNTLIRRIVEGRQPVRFDDALTDDTIRESKSAHELGLRSVMAVPLITRGRIIGVLSVENRGKFAQFNEEHLDFLQIFGHQAAVAIENARLYRSLRDAQAQLSRAHKALRLEVEESQEALRTERQRLETLESEVRHLDKMAAMGMMVSGIAHELNNPLTGALGFAQMLSLSDNLVPRQAKMLSHITSEMTRCAEIIRNLLKFSRKDRFQRTPTDLNRLLSDAVDLRRYQFEVNKVEVLEDFDPEIGVIELDHFQFRGVVLNMLNNSFDAIQEHRGHGTIKIGSQLLGDGMAQVTVADDGGGIAEIGKIFDPFYTTKDVGKGTGLGMSVAFGVVRAHGGTIQATNLAGGAQLTVSLPRTLATGTAPPVEDEPPVPTRATGGRILVVDDEEVIRELCQALLEGEGFQVDLACSGSEAKTFIQSNKYHLIITDIRMPGQLSGVDLYNWIKVEHAALSGHVVFITGDLMTQDVRSALGDAGNRLLTKPFDVSSLLSMVQSSLECS